MSAASSSPPNPLLSPQMHSLSRGISAPQLTRPAQHKLVYCKNGTPVSKSFEAFDSLLAELAALPQLMGDGVAVDEVQIYFNGERMSEQQCGALASTIAFRIPLKQLTFECKYTFDLNTRMWVPKVAEALIGDTGLMALLDSIGKNQDARIQSLVLKNCNIGYLGIQALEIGLRKKQFATLQILNIKMNPSVGSNIARLAQQLQNKTLSALTELNLSDCNLNIQGGIIMSRVFPGMAGLKVLNLEHCKVELVSLVGNPAKADGLACLTGLKVLEVAGNCLVESDDASYLGATKQEFFESLAKLTCLENLNLENCRLKPEGIQMFSKQCLCKLTKLTSLNVSVNGLVFLDDDEQFRDCLFDLADGIKHLKNLTSIKFNQGGFSRDDARALCQAIFELPRPIYSYDDNKRSIEGPIAIDINYCGPNPPLSGLKNSDLPRLMWWDDGNSEKWQYHYERQSPKNEQESKNKLGSQLMNVVEAMRGIESIRQAHVYHHNTIAEWHEAVARGLETSESTDKRNLHEELAGFHRQKAASRHNFIEQSNPESQLDIYEHMIKNPKQYNMLDDVHWPLHCGIQEYFADEVIEQEVVGQGGYGLVRKVTILRNRSVLNKQFCMKTLPYPTQETPSEIAKRNQLHTEIRCMAKFIRKELLGSSEVKNGHIPLRQGDWFLFQGESHHRKEFLTKFYCCRKVERSKMPSPQEWRLDLDGNGTCGPFAGPQCTDCLEFQKRYCPKPFEDHGYKNLMPVYGTRSAANHCIFLWRPCVMFKPNPDIFEFEAGKTTATGQTFSLIMKYLSFGSLMHRLDAGLAKFRESPSICRCSYVDWKEPDKMFIGVDDWELKLYLALGIARGIRAMHAELDVLAIAAAREFEAYPYDMMMDPKSPQISSFLSPATPRTLNSPIKEICKVIGISDQCSDHAEYLYSYFNSMKKQLDSTEECIAAACVCLAQQANQAGPECSIDVISSAFKCNTTDTVRLKGKLINLAPSNPPDYRMEIPVFYASVCDFGLSKPSGDSDSTDNDEKGSLPYMAPEIFEKRCRQNKHSNSVTPSALVATTPSCATPTRMTATTPHAASTPMATSLKEQDALKNKHRDIWAFGCVLYELATHRRPWYQIIEATSTFSDSHPADSRLPQNHPDPYLQPDPYLFFLRTLWRKLGKFHGGCQEGDDALELKFPNRRIPGCLLEAIRLCTQKDPEQRPHDIEIIIKELEKFSSAGSKRGRE